MLVCLRATRRSALLTWRKHGRKGRVCRGSVAVCLTPTVLRRFGMFSRQRVDEQRF